MRRQSPCGIVVVAGLKVRWAEDEDAKVGQATVLRRHKALMALARRLGDRSLAEATVGDIEAWLVTVAPRTKETYATAAPGPSTAGRSCSGRSCRRVTRAGWSATGW